MDPEAALRTAGDQLRAGAWDVALTLLEGYRTWRRAGGFEPSGGDARARWLERRAERLRGGRLGDVAGGKADEGGEGCTPEA